jgi:hypothetical protein
MYATSSRALPLSVPCSRSLCRLMVGQYVLVPSRAHAAGTKSVQGLGVYVVLPGLPGCPGWSLTPTSLPCSSAATVSTMVSFSTLVIFGFMSKLLFYDCEYIFCNINRTIHHITKWLYTFMLQIAMFCFCVKLLLC